MTWSVTANALASLTVLVAALLAARGLGVEGFGSLALMLSAQMVVTTALASSLGQVATKSAAELVARRAPGRLGAVRGLVTLVLTLLLGGLVLAGEVARDGMGAVLLGGEASVGLTRLALLAIVLAGLLTVQQAWLAGLGAFGALAAINGTRLAATLAGMALFVPRAGLGGALWAFALGSLVGSVAAAVVLRRLMPTGAQSRGWAGARSEIGVMVHLALPSWLSGTGFALAAWAANLHVSRAPMGMAEVGLFGVAMQLGRSAVLFFPQSLAAPLLVDIASARGAGEQTRPSMGRGVGLLVGSAVVPALIVALGAGPLLGLFGEDFVAGRPVMNVVLAGTLLATLTLGLNTVLVAHDRAWWVAFATALWVVVFAVLIGALAPTAMALATAYGVAYATQAAVTGVLTLRVGRTAVP